MRFNVWFHVLLWNIKWVYVMYLPKCVKFVKWYRYSRNRNEIQKTETILYYKHGYGQSTSKCWRRRKLFHSNLWWLTVAEFWVYSLDSTFSCSGNGLLGVSRLFTGKSDFLKNRLIRSFLMVLYFTYFNSDFLSVNVNVHIIYNYI